MLPLPELVDIIRPLGVNVVTKVCPLFPLFGLSVICAVIFKNEKVKIRSRIFFKLFILSLERREYNMIINSLI
jgi:hypothetical protein